MIKVQDFREREKRERERGEREIERGERDRERGERERWRYEEGDIYTYIERETERDREMKKER